MASQSQKEDCKQQQNETCKRGWPRQDFEIGTPMLKINFSYTYLAVEIKKIFCLLLTIAVVATNESQPETFDSIVALDGSGNFTTISEAISAAPDHSMKSYYIKIKAGIYIEHVHIGQEKQNIVLIGDGMAVTKITDNRSNSTGWTTSNSATVFVEGHNFTAIDITFENSAGQSGRQAVALKSSSNHSAFYKCGFEGYQDTLLAHKGYQFYRESKIYGTVDFIFGQATVVLQSCDIYVREPGEGHSNVITAQRRISSTETTGISIHNCKLKAAPGFNPRSGTKTYLGRPWRPYSRVVILQSFLGDMIDPSGWIPWGQDNSTLKLVYYGEYQNIGPGANTGQRNASRNLAFSEAEQFTVRNFIMGDTWIPKTKIPFNLDLL